MKSTQLPALICFLFFLLLSDVSVAATFGLSSADNVTGDGDERQQRFLFEQPLQLSLTYRNYGLGIGDVPVVHGVRINYRDHNLRVINGINMTIRQPKDFDLANSRIRGLAIGLPLTGGGQLRGISLAVFGAGYAQSAHGIHLSGLGLGSGGSVRGITVSGLGVGAGGHLRGITVAGLGAGSASGVSGVHLAGLGLGSGGPVQGVTFGGIGVGSSEKISGIALSLGGIGSSGSIRGITVAGLGAGSGESISGITLAGLGVGSGGPIHGLTFGGLGIGSGESIRGVMLSAVGIGSGLRLSGLAVAGLGIGTGGSITGVSLTGMGTVAGQEIRGLHISGVGMGSNQINGVTASLFTEVYGSATGLFIAPLRFRLQEDAYLRGVSIGAHNRIKGTQHGLTIGLYNFARHLNGVQIGLLNYAGNNPAGLRLLPLVNANL
ncbi:hypothetical protein QA596_11835 [Balneolales bacterium ANBcel1]|nr:hypothetical protein [Balneolales bacterium ANBcel1]